MMCKKEGFAMNNRGSTLVEIIVSVLIIAIVFVPLLMGMSAALKANGKAEQALNSENAAVDCMEAIKAVGKKGIEKLIVTPTDGATITPIPAQIFGANAKIEKKTETDEESGESFEYYLVSDIGEGLETYTAKISFSDANYVGEIPTLTGDPGDPTPTAIERLNDYEYVSFSNLSGKGTQMLKFLADTDDTKVNLLRSLAGNTAVDDRLKPLEATWNTADIVKTKEVELVIDKNGADEYTISTKINYELYNTYGTDTSPRFVIGGDTFSAADTTPLTTRCKNGKPDTLIVFYSPIATVGANFDHTVDALNKNKIKITKLTELDDLNVYVIVTGEPLEDGVPKTSYIGVEFDEHIAEEHKGKNHVFCSANLASAIEGFDKINNLYTMGGASGNESIKMYDVKVEVENVVKTGTIVE